MVGTNHTPKFGIKKRIPKSIVKCTLNILFSFTAYLVSFTGLEFSSLWLTFLAPCGLSFCLSSLLEASWSWFCFFFLSWKMTTRRPAMILTSYVGTAERSGGRGRRGCSAMNILLPSLRGRPLFCYIWLVFLVHMNISSPGLSSRQRLESSRYTFVIGLHA